MQAGNEKYICPVCGVEHEFRGGILVATPTNPALTKVVGYRMCEQHERDKENDRVFLVGVDTSQMEQQAGTVTPDDVVRTGSFVVMDEPQFREIFGAVPLADGRVVYVAQGVIVTLSAILERQIMGEDPKPPVNKTLH